MDSRNCLAVITARGGSKRIPHKNIAPFCGKPMIAYAIGAAAESGLFSEIMVSTDDGEIAEVARACGAKTPFMRSAENSDDNATTSDVLREVLRCYAQEGRYFETACCIYPTAPFLTGDVLKRAAVLLAESGADTVMPVVAFSFPPQRGMVMRGGRLSYERPECRDMRSQDLETIYHDCGQFYFFRTAPFLRTGVLVGENTAGIELPELRVQDIDNPQDLELAELKYRFLQEQAKREAAQP